MITSIRPSKIIHLAALSESEPIMKDPFETIYINGVVACKICDIIHKHRLNVKLFNTCSSEMFKGHKNYLVTDDDKSFSPTYPYAYGKILSYSMVEWYRNKYGYCFSNGILFSTESRNRKEGFLMRKLKDHIDNWKNGKKEVLKLGNIFSYRNMLYVDDVVNAIHLIMKQDLGDNYVISDEESNLVMDIIINFYEKNGFQLIIKDNFIYDKESDNKIIEFSTENADKINILGKSNLLKKIGWEIKYRLDNILDELNL